MELLLDKGNNGPHNLKKIKKLFVYIYIYVIILVILFYKFTLYYLNNIINSFESNAIITNFFTIFLQPVEVTNSYWFACGHTNYITFYITIIINHFHNL